MHFTVRCHPGGVVDSHACQIAAQRKSEVAGYHVAVVVEKVASIPIDFVTD
jgi:hypothetical protein